MKLQVSPFVGKAVRSTSQIRGEAPQKIASKSCRYSHRLLGHQFQLLKRRNMRRSEWKIAECQLDMYIYKHTYMYVVMYVNA